ncbi:hypothetical protein D3OALGA1CA_3407 [Olavius algarvensis associated proteobacterium Delta 3]|nr:hypothetical protein D3OALGB2SA_3339 [Olavius algarvensis associated proteobacterium Delta 3]CAB5133881.1 hypothetical protein D3OALGA1CA_3407 [Olavius algarvensis associated proteobacterium Delta 3]
MKKKYPPESAGTTVGDAGGKCSRLRPANGLVVGEFRKYRHIDGTVAADPFILGVTGMSRHRFRFAAGDVTPGGDATGVNKRFGF